MRQQDVEKLAAAAWDVVNTGYLSHGINRVEGQRLHLQRVLAEVDPGQVYNPRSPKHPAGVAIPAADAGTHT